MPCYAKSPQSYPTLCDPMDCSLPGFSIHGILQARTLEWVAISFSKAWKWKVKVKTLTHVQLFATPWTAAYWASLSMGFSRQWYWSGWPLPSPSYPAPASFSMSRLFASGGQSILLYFEAKYQKIWQMRLARSITLLTVCFIKCHSLWDITVFETVIGPTTITNTAHFDQLPLFFFLKTE